MLNYLPKYFTNKAMLLYFGALVFVSVIFYSHILPVAFMLFGAVEVVGFFYFSNRLTRQWGNFSDKKFNKNLFKTALIIRVVWVLFAYVFFSIMYGDPFEYQAADSKGYHGEAQWLVYMIQDGNLQPYFEYIKGRYSDMGYPFYLGWQYWITGGSILVARIIKALFGAWMCVLIYKLATRNFGESVGRMAGIFCMLMPNLIYYTGLHVKEAEMVLLTVLFVERSDLMLRNKNFNFVEIAPPLLIAAVLFFFRTVLGVTALFALFTALMFSSTKVVGVGKRIILIVWVVVTVSYFIGGSLYNEAEEIWNARSENQKTSMAYRSVAVDGNKFAKYGSTAVFAPIIFIMPFPSMVDADNQKNSQMIHGGNYVKNIMGFFVFFALIWIIKNQKWRDYILIGSFAIGYLAVIAMSSFAQAERFHQPALPFLLIIAAFGVSKVTNNEKKYFTWYMVAMFFVIVAWCWFKLAGRGLV